MKLSSQMLEFDRRVQRNLARGLKISSTAFVAKGAHLSGRVVLGKRASVWYGAILRGDIEPVMVGDGTNVQDGAILHTADDLPCCIGRRCTIGHAAIVHACSVEDDCLIGMGAIILDGSQIGAQSIIGAGSLITQHAKIPKGSLVFGSPAKVIRPLTPKERASIHYWADRYMILAKRHRSMDAK